MLSFQVFPELSGNRLLRQDVAGHPISVLAKSGQNLARQIEDFAAVVSTISRERHHQAPALEFCQLSRYFCRIDRGHDQLAFIGCTRGRPFREVHESQIGNQHRAKGNTDDGQKLDATCGHRRRIRVDLLLIIGV